MRHPDGGNAVAGSAVGKKGHPTMCADETLTSVEMAIRYTALRCAEIAEQWPLRTARAIAAEIRKEFGLKGLSLKPCDECSGSGRRLEEQRGA
jgi:hypothetical protein